MRLEKMQTTCGALFQPVIGWALDVNWDGKMAAGVRIYTVADFQSALSLLLVTLAIGFCCAVAFRG